MFFLFHTNVINWAHETVGHRNAELSPYVVRTKFLIHEIFEKSAERFIK